MSSESDLRNQIQRTRQIHALANKLNEVIEKLNNLTEHVTHMCYPHGDKMVKKVDIYDVD